VVRARIFGDTVPGSPDRSGPSGLLEGSEGDRGRVEERGHDVLSRHIRPWDDHGPRVASASKTPSAGGPVSTRPSIHSRTAILISASSSVGAQSSKVARPATTQLTGWRTSSLSPGLGAAQEHRFHRRPRLLPERRGFHEPSGELRRRLGDFVSSLETGFANLRSSFLHSPR
jgi:hypothetical protein